MAARRQRSALTMRRRWSCICSGMPSGEHFARARQLSEAGMAALIQRPDYLQAGQRLLSAPLAARWQRNCWMPLRATRAASRRAGPGRERLRRIALPMEDEALVLLLIEQMRESGSPQPSRLAAFAGA